MLTSLPPSGLLLFPPKQRVVCFPLVLSFNHQTELRLVIQLTRTPDQTSGRAFSYPTVTKHLRRFCRSSANSLRFYSGDDFFTQPRPIANMYRYIRENSLNLSARPVLKFYLQRVSRSLPAKIAVPPALHSFG